MNGLDLEVVSAESDKEKAKLLTHQSRSPNAAYPTLLAQMTYPTFQTFLCVLRQLEGRETYEKSVIGKIQESQPKAVDHCKNF